MLNRTMLKNIWHKKNTQLELTWQILLDAIEFSKGKKQHTLRQQLIPTNFS